MITDPVFYALAVFAVILIGLSKGGFGGALAMLGVPIVALVIPPIQAAAIFLPILVVMDLAGLYAWHGVYDRRTLLIMLPGAAIGILIGWLTAAYVNDSHIRLIVGVLALAFVAQWWFGGRERTSQPHHTLKGRFWGGGCRLYQLCVPRRWSTLPDVFALPLKLDKTVYVGTGVIFFAVVNAIKLPAYFALGQFTAQNLLTSAILIPLAPLATLAGAWLVKRVDQTLFYRITYAALLPVGVKLIWDGLSTL
jgi:uncharacterized membrane protein YfcA